MLAALTFLGIAISVVVGVHYYLWRRLVRATTRTRRARRTGGWVIAGLAALVVLTFVGSRVLPRPVATALAWPGYLWLAVMFYLLVILVVLEPPALLARLLVDRRPAHLGVAPVLRRWWAGRRGDAGQLDLLQPRRPGVQHQPTGSSTAVQEPGEAPAAPGAPGVAAGGASLSRRLLLARVVAASAGAASLAIVGSGVGAALGPPRLRQVQLPLRRLPVAADGLRIAVVADIHLGPLLGRAHASRIVDLVNGLDADLVAIVGDLVDGSVEELGSAAAPLAGLRSRYGTYFVTGNHEYYSGHEQWHTELASLGLVCLRNERVELPAGLDLAGVNDPTGGQYGDGPDFAKALAGRDPNRAVILMAHQPVQARHAAAHGVDLQLSGHTHGGQMRPFDLVVRLSGQPVVSGVGEVDGMPVYVTSGAGFWGPPVRVGVPPEISLVRLVATG